MQCDLPYSDVCEHIVHIEYFLFSILADAVLDRCVPTADVHFKDLSLWKRRSCVVRHVELAIQDCGKAVDSFFVSEAVHISTKLEIEATTIELHTSTS